MSYGPDQLSPGQLRLDVLESLEGTLRSVPEWAALKTTLHALWTKHVGTPGYDKREWGKLDNALYAFARRMVDKRRGR